MPSPTSVSTVADRPGGLDPRGEPQQAPARPAVAGDEQHRAGPVLRGPGDRVDGGRRRRQQPHADDPAPTSSNATSTATSSRRRGLTTASRPGARASGGTGAGVPASRACTTRVGEQAARGGSGRPGPRPARPGRAGRPRPPAPPPARPASSSSVQRQPRRQAQPQHHPLGRPLGVGQLLAAGLRRLPRRQQRRVARRVLHVPPPRARQVRVRARAQAPPVAVEPVAEVVPAAGLRRRRPSSTPRTSADPAAVSRSSISS